MTRREELWVAFATIFPRENFAVSIRDSDQHRDKHGREMLEVYIVARNGKTYGQLVETGVWPNQPSARKRAHEALADIVAGIEFDEGRR